MRIFKNKRDLLIVVGLFGLYLLTRLLLFTHFPMLNDESIYLHWAQEIVRDKANLVLPVTEGRQPLFIWIVSLFLKVIKDPLLSGRLVSACAGMITATGLYFVTKELFKNKDIAYISVLLYIVSPFALVYDRLALLDSLVTAFTIWSIYFTIIFARKLRLDNAYTLGFVIGGGLITKSNGVFNLYLLPLSLLLIDWKSKNYKKIIIRWLLLLVVIFIVSQLIQSIMTIIPQYSRILDVNQIFITPKKEFIRMPIALIINNFFYNLKVLSEFFVEYFTIPYLLLIFVAFFLHRSFYKEKIWLLLYFLIPFLIFALFARQMLPRYIYFMTISLFPLCSVGFVFGYQMLTHALLRNKQKKKIMYKALYSILVLTIPAFISLHVIRDIRTAPVPKVEKIHYAAREESFVRESIKIIEKESRKGKVLVVIEGYIGWAPNMYEVMLNENKNIEIKSYIPISDNLPPEVIKIASSTPTFVILPRFAENKVSINLPLNKILEEKIVLGEEDQKRDYYFRMYRVVRL